MILCTECLLISLFLPPCDVYLFTFCLSKALQQSIHQRSLYHFNPLHPALKLVHWLNYSCPRRSSNLQSIALTISDLSSLFSLIFYRYFLCYFSPILQSIMHDFLSFWSSLPSSLHHISTWNLSFTNESFYEFYSITPVSTLKHLRINTVEISSN
jgi:hypothetical protein